MKHITRHRDTHGILERWSHPARPINAAFFFYHRGSKIQKSFDGLVRSILLQILIAMPALCNFIPEKCLPQPGRVKFDWNPANLDDALQSVLAQRPTSLKICLFIDALDEFDGHLEILADFLKNLINGGCKVCFSSRPRDILEKHFGSCPGISIHDHTKRDIQIYTVERLANLPGVRGSTYLPGDIRDAIKNAVKEIRQKANGVFLWVKLALDRIEQDKVPTSGLFKHLHDLPTELEDFYASIIDRIPHEFRWETYLTLDVIFRAFEEQNTRTIFQIVQCAQCQTLDECLEALQNRKDFCQFCYDLKERCGGLIEIPEPFNLNNRVRLMHETVREFISSPRFQEVIVGPAAIFNAQNGYTELAKLFLVAAKCPPNMIIFGGHEKQILLKLCMSYCHFAESTTGLCQSELIDSLKPSDWKKLHDIYFENERIFIPGFPTSAVDFAVRSGLSIYIQQKLANSENVESISQEVLHSVTETTTETELLNRENLWYQFFDIDLDRMARIALERSRSRYPGATAFGSLLLTQTISQCPEYAYDLGVTINRVHGSERLINLARVFLENGQDPDMEMIEESRFVARPCGSPKGPRPLHIAFNNMAELILSYNADPNARDRAGRTPLDVAL